MAVKEFSDLGEEVQAIINTAIKRAMPKALPETCFNDIADSYDFDCTYSGYSESARDEASEWLLSVMKEYDNFCRTELCDLFTNFIEGKCAFEFFKGAGINGAKVRSSFLLAAWNGNRDLDAEVAKVYITLCAYLVNNGGVLRRSAAKFFTRDES